MLLLLALSMPASAGGGEFTWVVDPIDCPRGFGLLTHSALAADDDGGLHIAYGGRHLYYAYRPSGASAWRFEIADDTPDVGSGAALALDDAGLPHSSYCTDAGSGIRHAFRDAAGWHVEIVYAPPKAEMPSAKDVPAQDAAEPANSPVGPAGGGEHASCATSLAVGEDGSVHIAFHPAGPAHGLKYAYRDEAGWHIFTLDGGDFAGAEPSLALDSAGYPRISYYGGYPYYDLRYASRDAGGWHTLSLPHDGDAGLYSSLAIDGQDRAHIAYYEGYAGDLVYVSQEGNQWNFESVDTEGYVGVSPSLVLNADDKPVISYLDAGSPSLIKLARRDAGGWQKETILSTSSMKIIGDTTLALDPSGVPRVAFFDAAVQLLHLFWPDPAGGWLGEAVDRAGTAGDNSSLKLDAQGYPHISYYADYLRGGPFFGHLKHAWQDASGWHDETVDVGGDPGRGSSLQIDEAGVIHISYLSRDTGRQVLYARNEGGGGSPELVDSGATNPGPTSLDLDADGNPSVAYVDAYGLKLARRDSRGWLVGLVVDQGTPATCDTPQASLVLDTDDRPHIAYSLCSPSELRYALRDAAGWHFEVVDTGGDVGRYNSLALDEAGQPRIAYYAGYPHHELRYAWRDADGWHREMAFGGGDDGLYPSLVLNRAGWPVISFLSYMPDRTTMSLGVAERNEMGWNIGVGLYIGIDTRPGTSLALDAADRPVISFSGDGGLRIGHWRPWKKTYFPLIGATS